MKSRLESAPLTSEDLDIWWNKVHWGTSTVLIGALGCISIETDRRDADLMLDLSNRGRCRLAAAHAEERTRQSHHVYIPPSGWGTQS